jgi:hypothetical protein
MSHAGVVSDTRKNFLCRAICMPWGTPVAPQSSRAERGSMMRRSWIPLTQTGPRVTDEDVRQFERTIGHELPADYRAFLVDVNGGYAPSSNCVFRLPKDTTVLNSFYSLNTPNDVGDLASAQLYPPYPQNNLPGTASPLATTRA